jgi:hypothetical protein
MNSSKKYFASDFTTAAYEEMLKSALEYYTFVDFKNFSIFNGPSIINRHDLDFSIHRALALAKIENRLGIRSTYFINPHCEFYNPLERAISDLLLEINDLGHELGLHFDSHYWGISNQVELDRFLKIDQEIIERILGIQVYVFSFHNTTSFTMSCKKEEYGGLLNAYSEKIFNKFKYCSDSNGYWRFDRMPALIESREFNHLHLLTHPEWWTDEVSLPWNKIKRAIIGRSNANLNLYKTHLEKFGMKNIGFVEDKINEIKK